MFGAAILNIFSLSSAFIFTVFIQLSSVKILAEVHDQSIVSNQDWDQKKDDWVDPGNMFGHDSQKFRIKPGVASPSSENKFNSCEEVEQELQDQQLYLRDAIKLLTKTNLEADQKTTAVVDHQDSSMNKTKFSNWHLIRSLIKQNCKCSQSNVGHILLNRLIGTLLKTFKNWDARTLYLTVTLSTHEQELLQDVLDRKQSVTAVDDILLATLFSDPSVVKPMSATFSQTVSESLYNNKEVVFVVIVLLSIYKLGILLRMVRISKRQCLLIISVIGICLSVFKEWMHLYEKEVSKQHIAMMKHDSMEEACHKESTMGGILNWVKSHFLPKNDECANYVETMYINPFWKVTILQAATEAISKMLTQPISHFATSLSSFIHIMAKDLPLYLSQPATYLVIFFMLFMIYVVISYIFGFGFRFRFFGMSMETINSPIPQFTSSSTSLSGDQPQQLKNDPSIEALPTSSTAATNQLKQNENENTSSDDKAIMKYSNKVITFNVQTLHIHDPPKESICDTVVSETSQETNVTLVDQLDKLSVIEKDLSINKCRASAGAETSHAQSDATVPIVDLEIESMPSERVPEEISKFDSSKIQTMMMAHSEPESVSQHFSSKHPFKNPNNNVMSPKVSVGHLGESLTKLHLKPDSSEKSLELNSNQILDPVTPICDEGMCTNSEKNHLQSSCLAASSKLPQDIATPED